MTTFIKSQRKASYHEAVTQAQEKKQTAFGDFKRDEIYDEARRQGMITLRQDGILKALQGIVSVEDVLRETAES